MREHRDPRYGLYGNLFGRFVRGACEPPYTVTLSEHAARTAKLPVGTRFRIFPVTCKTGYAASRTTMLAHDVVAAAGCVDREVLLLAARWRCSEGAAKAVFLPTPDATGARCHLCEVLSDITPGVYRCYDDSGSLVYVGSSAMPSYRIHQHSTSAASADWWKDVTDVQVSRYQTVEEACAAEASAIRSESPRLNRLMTVPERRRVAA